MHDIESSECDSTRKQRQKKFPFHENHESAWLADVEGKKSQQVRKIFPLTQMRGAQHESEENFSLV